MTSKLPILTEVFGPWWSVRDATLRAWEEGRNRLRDDKAALLERLLKDHPTVSEPPDAGMAS